MRKLRHVRQHFEIGWVRRAKDIDAVENAMGATVVGGTQIDATAAGVSGKECDIQAAADRMLQVVEHVDGIILIVADGEKALGAQQRFGIEMCIEVRDISHIVALRFEPIGQRELPQEPFT